MLFRARKLRRQADEDDEIIYRADGSVAVEPAATKAAKDLQNWNVRTVLDEDSTQQPTALLRVLEQLGAVCRTIESKPEWKTAAAALWAEGRANPADVFAFGRRLPDILSRLRQEAQATMDWHKQQAELMSRVDEVKMSTSRVRLAVEGEEITEDMKFHVLVPALLDDEEQRMRLTQVCGQNNGWAYKARMQCLDMYFEAYPDLSTWVTGTNVQGLRQSPRAIEVSIDTANLGSGSRVRGVP